MFKESGLVVLSREGEFLLDVAQRAGRRSLSEFRRAHRRSVGGNNVREI